MGWGVPSLPKRPVFIFMAASVQPQNRQITNELECCKNIHIRNVYLDKYIYLEGERAFMMASSLVEDRANPYPCLGPEGGEGT